MGTDILRIGNAGGYWGDDLGALQRQIDGGPIDVITMDFLAEITMSILHKQLRDQHQAAPLTCNQHHHHHERPDCRSHMVCPGSCAVGFV